MKKKIKKEKNETIRSIRNIEDLLLSEIRKAGLISMKEAVARRGCTRQAIINLANIGRIEMFLIGDTSYVFRKEIDANPPKGSK